MWCLGVQHDPITPFSGAQGLANELGDSAKLVRMNGFGVGPFHMSTPGHTFCSSVATNTL